MNSGKGHRSSEIRILSSEVKKKKKKKETIKEFCDRRFNSPAIL